jgi:hypothetical protein
MQSPVGIVDTAIIIIVVVEIPRPFVGNAAYMKHVGRTVFSDLARSLIF